MSIIGRRTVHFTPTAVTSGMGDPVYVCVYVQCV